MDAMWVGCSDCGGDPLGWYVAMFLSCGWVALAVEVFHWVGMSPVFLYPCFCIVSELEQQMRLLVGYGLDNWTNRLLAPNFQELL